ncbi:uncharacterized protein PAC_07390 [Phialocephala subalpina]|uniref:AB hydrolase-1 domain-containing protein n=1 Tax=Phialocephala subalpina TaxID=576137 RepID=A0A1L7WXL1_9HELO|nr:uncharacterized protein PAC_07390 [Phialocephala subalpina]
MFQTPRAPYTYPEPTALTIASKPESPIVHTYFPPNNPAPVLASEPPAERAFAHRLIVFVNGLGLPASSWLPTIKLLHAHTESCPSILTYDRFGQGLTTVRDPLDGTPGKERGHDFLDVVNDLHEIILRIAQTKIGVDIQDLPNGEKFQVIFIGASIGAAICRLYVQHHPGIAVGMMLLDSNIANADYSDVFPDPDAPDFDPTTVVKEDYTLEQYIEARKTLVDMFGLHVLNLEMLDRSNSPVLLPYADKPKLKGVTGKNLQLMVVGHDTDKFAELSLESPLKTPKSVSMIINKYNKGLTKITEHDYPFPVEIAKGCGHFIQKDDPAFVARMIKIMFQRTLWGDSGPPL